MASHRHRSRAQSQYPQSTLKRTVAVIKNIVGPVLPEHHWDVLTIVHSPAGNAGKGDTGSGRVPKGGGK